MNILKYKRVILWPVILMMSLAVTGCRKRNTTGNSLALATSHNGVIANPNRYAAELGAEDILALMRAAGLTDKSIVDLGPDLRTALATTGGATIRVAGKVEAICMAEPHRIVVTSRMRGPFVYDLKGDPQAIVLKSPIDGK
ncbi:MAG TPA: hypothetical protein VEK08_08980 [Planctomycetota bacterium]|nr:hypothetical protein [Planctomycetota bacterium]